MFININGTEDEPNNMVSQPQNNLKLTKDLKGKIDECLKLAQEKPGVRKQILGTLQGLEDQLNDIRAEEGFLAQMKAQ